MATTGSDLVREAHLRAKCEDALAAVEEALAAEGPVREMEEADALEQKVVRLRDALIDLVRHDTDRRELQGLRAALEHVNAALSLIAGVEYPSRGPPRDLLKEAKGILRQLLRRAPFRAG